METQVIAITTIANETLGLFTLAALKTSYDRGDIFKLIVFDGEHDGDVVIMSESESEIKNILDSFKNQPCNA